MRYYHEQLEFDFDERNWDILDVWRGRITLRKLWIRINNLPLSATFIRAAAPNGVIWDHRDHMRAHHIDLTYRLLGSEQNYPRPGEKAAETSRRQQRAANFERRQRERLEQRKGASDG